MADRPNKVTFITQSGQLDIRLMDDTTNAACQAARDFGARYYITVDAVSVLGGTPRLGVFDMRTAQKDNPVRGMWSINDPIKTFALDQLDAAVMWAMHRRDV